VLDGGKVAVVDSAFERCANVGGVYYCPEVCVIGFYVHVLLVQEMVYHCDGFVWIATLAGPVEGHAVLRIRAAGDDVVKQPRVPQRGDEVEDFEGVVARAASPERICNLSVLIYTIGVRTVVDQPVECFAVMGKIPGDLSVSLAPFGQRCVLALTGASCGPRLSRRSRIRRRV
jgi:hypothetical protein